MLNRRMRPQRASGFTLIEVMVVIVIIGILAALVVPKVMSRPDEARAVAARQDIASLMQALKLYRLDNRRYPSTEQGLQALVTKPSTAPVPEGWKTGGYIERLQDGAAADAERDGILEVYAKAGAKAVARCHVAGERGKFLYPGADGATAPGDRTIVKEADKYVGREAQHCLEKSG